MRPVNRILTLIPFLALAACNSAAGWSGTVRDSAGIAIVDNPTTGIWAGEAPVPTVELDIGAASGDVNVQFATVTSIEVDGAGNIYVLDNQAQEVRVFDADGSYLRTMGGPGSGPGELGMGIAAIILGAGDTLLVPDMLQGRLTRFSPDGESAGSVPMPMQAGIAMRWEPLPDGRILQQSMAMPNPQNPQPLEGYPLLVRSSGGAITDTLLTLPPGGTLQMRPGQMQIRLFEAEPMWTTLTDGGVAFGMNSDYSIRMHSPSGELLRIIRLPFERRPVTEEDQQGLRDLMVDAMVQQAGALGAPPEQLAQAREMMQSLVQFAEHYPAFSNIRGGPGGSLWVQHVRTAADAIAAGETIDLQNAQEMGSGEWDVFDAEGRFYGVVQMPERFTPLRIKGDRIYGVQRDDFDVPHVVRLHFPVDWTTAPAP